MLRHALWKALFLGCSWPLWAPHLRPGLLPNTRRDCTCAPSGGRSSVVLLSFVLNVSHGIVVVIQSLSHVQLFVIPWTVAHQAPLSMGFSRQGYWSGQPFHSPESSRPRN